MSEGEQSDIMPQQIIITIGMQRNQKSEGLYMSKFQIKELKRRRNSPEGEKVFLIKDSFKEELRHISPQLQAKTSRPKSSHKAGLYSCYENSSGRYFNSQTSSKKRSSQDNSKKEYKPGSTGRSKVDKGVKVQATKIANNLKDILDRHLMYRSQKKKASSKKESSKDKQKYLTPRKMDVYEKELRKSQTKHSSSKGFGGSFHKLEPMTLKISKPKVKKFQTKDDSAFRYQLRYGYRSRKGKTPNNPNKPNQDSYIIQHSMDEQKTRHYFGVCDGHGALGHKVAEFLKVNLPLHLNKSKSLADEPVEALTSCFRDISAKLNSSSKIDVSLSGATCVGCYINYDTLYCCNVGDSRAIVGSYEKHWEAHQLSEDHKPSVESQAQRIKEHKGVIEPYMGEHGYVGPLRVWLSQRTGPGLAMTRSFGDAVAASVGVSSIPQIKQYKLSQRDKIIVIASDGVWEFMENIDVISLLSSFYEQNELDLGCDKLLYTVFNRWANNSSVIDDITFVVIFLYY